MWYVIQSKPNQEYRLAASLDQKNLNHYFPVLSIKEKLQPLFPGYMFLNCPRESNWSDIKCSPGLQRVLSFGHESEPLQIPEATILGIKARIKALSEQAERDLNLHPGDKVVVTDGPLEGLEGAFFEAKGKDRAYILLEHIYSSKVQVPIKSIARI
jgi:transcription antitermination factor NusG